MKTYRLFFISLLVALMPSLAMANTYTDPATGVKYEYTVGKTEAAVASDNSTSLSGSINILSSFTVNGKTYTVTSISSWAFYYCSRITSVSIPNTIKTIGVDAFRICGLRSVTIPNSVTTIESGAFAYCELLTSFTLPNSVTNVGHSILDGCYNLNTPIYNDNLFVYLPSSYTSYTIPSGIKTIAKGAFYNRYNLRSVTIPNTVTTIEMQAFQECGLSSVTIPSSVNSIGQSAFAGCNNLTSIVVESGNSKYDSHNNCNAIIETNKKTLIAGCRNTIIPNDVTSIGASAFRYCTGLTSITIPNNVISIEESAFEGCSNLKTISLPNGVTSIKDYTFSDCEGLTSINIPNSVTNIGNYAFGYCTSISNITIPNGVTTIGAHAFAECSSLTSLKLSESLTNVNDSAFVRCTALTSVDFHCKQVKKWFKGHASLKNLVFGDEVTSIMANAFEDCTALNTVNLPNNVSTINARTFANCANITTLSIGKKVSSITGSAFSGCDKISTIKFHSNKIDSWFNKRSSLKNVTIGSEVTYIGSNAFEGCTGLTSISIPDNVAIIGPSAFQDCTGITSVTIPEKVTQIGMKTFLGCSGLTSITMSTGITTINSSAFDGCTKLTSLTIPSSVNYIGSSAFANCKSLAAMKLPDSVKVINSSLFEGCTALRSVSLSNKTTDIKASAFSGCSLLKFFSIPNTVTAIGEKAFQDCVSLTTINLPYSLANMALTAFSGCTGLSSVEFHCSNIESWFCNMNNLKSIVLGNEVKTIGVSAFSGCNSLSSLSIPNNITSIGSEAFKGCTGLTSVDFHCNSIDAWFNGMNNLKTIIIGDEVKSIAASAFSGCTGLSSISIGKGLNDMGSNAFENCGNQLEVTFHNNEIKNWFTKNNSLKTVIVGDEVMTISDAAFKECSLLESITIGKNVTSIAYDALMNCEALTSIVIDSNNGTYDSRNNCNAVIKTITNTLEIGCKNSKIQSSVTRLGTYAFYLCKALTAVRIPKTLSSIGAYAFSECKNLNQVSTDIMDPSEIQLEQNHCFDGIANNAVLVVPKGRKAAFEASSYWKNSFAQIIEDENVNTIVNFEYDGKQYRGDYYEGTAVVTNATVSTNYLDLPSTVSYNGINFTLIGIEDNAINGDYNYIYIPNTIQSIGPKALSGCKTKCIFWYANTALPAEVISNSKITQKGNVLFYVTKATYAPNNLRNIVVNNVAENITLSDDGGEFFCPQTFTANQISYTHNYTMPTVKGTCQGWETLVLPFDVEKIVHEQRGEIVPFANYTKDSDQRPFWLYELSNTGFVKTNVIKANTPYILSMPNDVNAYDQEYLLGGKVTFSATNVTVKASYDLNTVNNGWIWFIPTFSNEPRAQGYYALNVNNDYVQSANGLAPGSCFINNLRDIRPFEAYITNAGAGAREIIDITFADEVTEIIDIASYNGKNSANTIYTLSGMKIATVSESELKQTLNALPCGIYIVDGKKLIKQ